MDQRPNSLVDILRWRASHQPDKLVYRFLVDGEDDEVVWTYAALDRQARAVAAMLQSVSSPGDRALVIFPPGLDFIAAYFGCLYAGVMAIPAYPPHPARPERNIPIILRIAADARPVAALMSGSLLEVIRARKEMEAGFEGIRLVAVDGDQPDGNAEQWQEPEIRRDDIAFLQYTSGSTTAPKGVMVSHANLLHNMSLIGACFGVSAETHGVIWLPPYHDMGLIGGILQPVYSGIPVTLMPHMMFLQRPVRWLQAISRFKATISGGPNFAYDLCVRKIKPEQREALDLMSWEVAFNGAEPVYHKTLDQFADYFAPCGFRREAFLPCYGLAESTLMVVGGPKARPPLTRRLSIAGIEEGKAIPCPGETPDARTFVSCGPNVSEQRVTIVNVERLTPCRPDEIGEIWVRGPSVARGYWNKAAETEYAFGAHLSDGHEGPYLRSGDLGFLHDGELYVTGRLKNLIICEGKNHYPQDIERTVEAAHTAIRPAGSAVFSIYNSGGEDIVVVAEIEHRLLVQAEEVIHAIREAVATHHGLSLRDIRLVKPGGIPRTTSGKIRHFLCKEFYQAGTLKEITLT